MLSQWRGSFRKRTHTSVVSSQLLSENGRVKTHVETRSITKLLFFENSFACSCEPARVRRTLQLCGGQNNQKQRYMYTLKSALLTSAGGFVLQTIKVLIWNLEILWIKFELISRNLEIFFLTSHWWFFFTPQWHSMWNYL